MNKTTISIGAVMLAAAAAGIYFPELPIRIAAGVIFVAGAVLLYLAVAKEGAESETHAHEDGVGDAGDESSGDDHLPSRAAALSGVMEHGATVSPQAHAPRARGKRSTEIPVEYYRTGEEGIPLDDPRAEFDFLTGRLLQVLKDHLIAHTVGLFWINADRQQIVIGEFVTDSRNFTTARRVPLGTDLISLIGTTEKPQILPEIGSSSEQDLLIYYDAREGVQSFVGVPVFFQGEPIAVLTADSMAPDAFGGETVASMGRFTSFLSQLLASYNQKFDLAADARLLGVITRMRAAMLESNDSYGVASAAAKAMSEIVDWDYLAVILFNTEKRVWTVIRSQSKATNLPYVSEGVTVSMETSVFRQVFDDMRGRLLDAPRAPEHRFHEKEAIASADGQICVVPIVNPRRCMGLLVAEYREGHQYGSRDLSVLTQLADMTGMFLEAALYHELIHKFLLIDEITMVSSRALLLQRLTEEHLRIQRHGGTSVFFLVGVDNADELLVRHGQEGLDTIMTETGRLMRAAVQSWDVLGRYDATRFGLLLLHTNAEEAYLRGEKIRKAVASHVFAFTGTSFSVTVSLAGCAFTEGTQLEQVLKVSQQAMNLAVGDSGNCVKVV